MNRANTSFFNNPKLIQLFNRYGTYNGSNPYRAPATLNVIPQLEMLDGAYLPQQGMYSITQTLLAEAEALGVTFHYNAPVESINCEAKSSFLSPKSRIKGITVHQKNLDFDAVVANVDAKRVYNTLLQKPIPQKIAKAENSSSALIFYWGISREFPELDVHNIFFSEHYEREFDHLFGTKDLDDDPTVYINITSKHCKDDAPAGKENWFVMINAPANYGQNWEDLRAFARKNILKKLSQHLGCDIESLIEEEDYLDPVRIEERTGSNRGSLYGSSSNHRMSAFFRQSNFSSSIQGLYFCGGSVHPGGGIPLCIQSANIVSKCLR
jgi:phytoene desaturase